MSYFCSALGRLVDGIKINSVSREVRNGRTLWVKRRRRTAGLITAGANCFFRLSGQPVRALQNLSWQRWEVDCFHSLHGATFRAFADGNDGIAVDEVPGEDLSRCLDRGALNPRMTESAGRELRRAHAWKCSTFGAAWSHGDPHAGNFVYDPITDETRLIDFEVMHDPALPATERHAEDLLAFLQDMAGRLPRKQWLPSAQAFLAGYARREIIERLGEKLFVPGGLARVWWAVRTSYMSFGELQSRMQTLRESLE